MLKNNFALRIQRRMFTLFYGRYLAQKPLNTFIKHASADIASTFQERRQTGKRLILATQVGRGGGKWLCDIFNNHDGVAAFGERNRLAESLYRFTCSHNLQWDCEGFFDLVKSEAVSDWERAGLSYISSPYFSHGLSALVNVLQPWKVVILLNDHFRTAVSLYNKGWYLEAFATGSDGGAPFPPPQFQGRENHFFGRYIRFSVERQTFKKLSRMGKIAVFMSTCLRGIHESLRQIDPEKLFIFKLQQADQNYSYYLQLAKLFELTPLMSKKRFLSLKRRTSAKFENAVPQFPSHELEEYKYFIQDYCALSDEIDRSFD